MDTVSKEQRHLNMSHIKGKNTSLELKVRKRLYHDGYRYRVNVPNLPGKPDIVLSKYNTVIFINGCFWHKHDCGRFVWPSSNEEYWHKKINRNIERDADNLRTLTEQGWRVITIWECQLKKKVAEENLLRLYNEITK